MNSRIVVTFEKDFVQVLSDDEKSYDIPTNLFNRGVNARVFDNVEDARNWLKLDTDDLAGD